MPLNYTCLPLRTTTSYATSKQIHTLSGTLLIADTLCVLSALLLMIFLWLVVTSLLSFKYVYIPCTLLLELLLFSLLLTFWTLYVLCTHVAPIFVVMCVDSCCCLALCCVHSVYTFFYLTVLCCLPSVFFLSCCCCCLLLNYWTERELLNQHSHPHLESLTREERNCKMNSIYIPRRQSLFLRHSVWEAKTWCRSKLHRHAHNYYFPTL